MTVRSEKLDVKEEDFYSALYTQSQAQFNTYLQSGTVLNNYAHIFDILIRLRQAVDHPYLVIYSEAQVAKQNDSENYLNLNNSGKFRSQSFIEYFLCLSCYSSSLTCGFSLHIYFYEFQLNLSCFSFVSADGVKIKTEPTGSNGNNSNNCDLCHEPCEDPVSSASCDHMFCRLCITDYIGSMSTSSNNNSNGNGLRCPDCDHPLTIQLLPSSPTATKDTPTVRGTNRWSSSNNNSRNGSTAADGDVNGSAKAGDSEGDQQQQDSLSVWNAAKVSSVKMGLCAQQNLTFLIVPDPSSRSLFPHLCFTYRSFYCHLQGLSRKSILDKVDLNLFQSSTKIEALMEVHSMLCVSFMLLALCTSLALLSFFSFCKTLGRTTKLCLLQVVPNTSWVSLHNTNA